MATETKHNTNREDVDRLVLLLAAEARDGWETIFDAIRKREVERIFGLIPEARDE